MLTKKQHMQSMLIETDHLEQCFSSGRRQQDALRKKAAEERKKELQKNIENKAPEVCNLFFAG